MAIGAGGVGACTFDLKMPCRVTKPYQCPGQGIGNERMDKAGRTAYVKLEEEEEEGKVIGGRKIYNGVLFASTISLGYVGIIHKIPRGYECYSVGAEGRAREPISGLRLVLPRIFKEVGENTGLGRLYFKGGDLDKGHADVATTAYMHNIRNRYTSKEIYKEKRDELSGIANMVDDFHRYPVKDYEEIDAVRMGDQVIIKRPKSMLSMALRITMVAGKSGISKHGRSDDVPDIINDVAKGIDPADYLMFKKAWCAGDFNIEAP